MYEQKTKNGQSEIREVGEQMKGGFEKIGKIMKVTNEGDETKETYRLSSNRTFAPVTSEN